MTTHGEAWARLRGRRETTSAPGPDSTSTDTISSAAVPDVCFVPDITDVQADLAVSDSPHGRSALGSIRMQSRDSTTVDSSPDVVPVGH